MAKKNFIIDDDSNELRYIPVVIAELLKGLLAEKPIQESKERSAFERFAKLLQAHYHAQYFERHQDLNRYYQPFNPDQETTSLEDWPENVRSCYQDQLFKGLKWLMKKANYDELTEEHINQSLTQELTKNLSVDVEMGDFDQVIFFVRGEQQQKIKRRHWRTLFLTSSKVPVATYRRLCVVFRFQTEEKLREHLKQRGMSRFSIWRHIFHHRAVMQSEVSQDYIFLRLFRDVPKSDLEMLFPNSKIYFTFFDKIKLGVTGGAGAVGGLWALLSKLAIAVKPLTILMALFGFGSLISRQVSNVMNHQNNYKMVLSRSLYSHSLDINVGVMSALIDQARDEEIKEALLAYYFLMRAGKQGMTMVELDKKIERHLMLRYGVFVNFEVDDAVIKLKLDGLVKEDTEDSGGVLYAVPLEEASQHIVNSWEDIFSVAKRMSLLSLL